MPQSAAQAKVARRSAKLAIRLQEERTQRRNVPARRVFNATLAENGPEGKCSPAAGGGATLQGGGWSWPLHKKRVPSSAQKAKTNRVSRATTTRRRLTATTDDDVFRRSKKRSVGKWQKWYWEVLKHYTDCKVEVQQLEASLRKLKHVASVNKKLHKQVAAANQKLAAAKTIVRPKNTQVWDASSRRWLPSPRHRAPAIEKDRRPQ